MSAFNSLTINGWRFSHTTKGGTQIYKHESGHEALIKRNGVRVINKSGELVGASRNILEEMGRWTK